MYAEIQNLPYYGKKLKHQGNIYYSGQVVRFMSTKEVRYGFPSDGVIGILQYKPGYDGFVFISNESALSGGGWIPSELIGNFNYSWHVHTLSEYDEVFKKLYGTARIQRGEIIINGIGTANEAPKITTKKRKIETMKHSIKINVKHQKGRTHFVFSVPKEIEALYARYNPEIKTSAKWAGTKFYYIPALTNRKEYKDKLIEFGLFDDYGAEFMVDGKVNIAWLRCVGGEGDIELKENLPMVEAVNIARSATAFLRAYFEEYFSEYDVAGSVSVEV